MAFWKATNFLNQPTHAIPQRSSELNPVFEINRALLDGFLRLKSLVTNLYFFAKFPLFPFWTQLQD